MRSNPRTWIGKLWRWCLLLVCAFSGEIHGLGSSKAYSKPSHPQQYVARVWQTQDGLPENWVNDIAQDKQGYLWVATIGGVARFDGVQFSNFNPPGMPRPDRTLVVYESRTGALWIGTVDQGITHIENGLAVAYGEREGLPSKFVSSVVEDRNGNVWINTSKGTARFDGTKLEPYPIHRGTPVTEFLLHQSDGSMWFRSGKDVVRFGSDGVKAATHGASIIHEARDGSVWIAFYEKYRLVRYHHGTFSDVPLPKTRRPQWAAAFPEQGVVAMATDTNGELLLLTAAGIARAVNGQLTRPEPVSLPDHKGVIKASSLTVDREGNLWIGTMGSGLVRVRPAPLTAYGKNEGLSDSPFTAVFQDRERRVWLGGDSLYWFDGWAFHLFPGLVDVRAIAQSRDGDLWFGGSGGLYRWRSGALTRFKIAAPAVNHILQDRDGTMWVAAPSYDLPGGFYRFRDGNFERIAAAGTKIAEDRKGGIWQATREGLRYMRDGNAVFYPQTLGGTPDIYQDSSGSLWLANYGVGLIRFRDRKYKPITVKDGLPNDRLEGMVADEHGYLWVCSDHNILRFLLTELNDFADGGKISSIAPISYGVAEGMRSSECNGGDPGGWRTVDGRIWFPTMRGVVVIDPASVNHVVPPVVLEEARANDLSLCPSGDASLPPRNNTFDFRFTALSFSAPEKVQFKYRLDPYDREWIEAGTQRTAHYTNMAPGTYSFHVIAANDFGVWNEQGASLNFVLRPHYYQTNWFRALCAMLLLGIIWAVHQLRVHRLHHQFAMTLDTRVAERTRIARELHDTLLQSFHGLLLRFQTVSQLLPDRPVDAKNKLDGAIQQAADAITEGRDAVQALRDSTLQRNDLALAISTLGKELATDSASGEPIKFRVTVEGEARELHPIVRDEIYKIAAESLRNAFKHAQASQVEVEIRYDDEQFRLRVRDDGKGIEPAVLSNVGVSGHFGLHGMQERAKLIGGTLTIWSEVAAGTELELRLPARAAYSTGRKSSWLSRKFAAKA